MNNSIFKDIDDVLTPEEVRKLLKVGKSKMYELIKNGDIPSFKISYNSRKHYITKASLIQYLQRINDMPVDDTATSYTDKEN